MKMDTPDRTGKRRFVILDRDGTMIVERHYLSDPEQIELIPETVNGLRELRALGLGVVVVTNQSALGRGLIDRARLDLIHRRLQELLAQEGIYLDAIYFCPHTPEDGCLCRKPQSGLMDRAARDFGFDPGTCFVIGDKACDIEFGRRAGAVTFLVRTGYGATTAREENVHADYVVAHLEEAAQKIKAIVRP